MTYNAQTHEATTTDGNEPQAGLRTSSALGSSNADIEEANVMIIIAPPRLEYVRQRPTILGKPSTNLTVLCDTLEDFITHQAQSIKDIQHVLDAYKHRRLSSCRLSPPALIARLKAHKVIKAETEAMLECLPAEQALLPFGQLSLSLYSRRPGRSYMAEAGLSRLIHRPTVHIFAKHIDNAASANTLPINKAAKDQSSGFSSGNRQQQQEEELQSNQGLLELFRSLLDKAHHDSRRGSNSSEWTAFSDSDSTDYALKALEHLNVDAGEAYIALCAALQETLNPYEP